MIVCKELKYRKLCRILAVVPFVVAAVLSVFLLASCQRQRVSGNRPLEFSSDTILFDTVFTTISSSTRYFTVKNTSSEDMEVDISLAGGKLSFYSMNVDGVAGVSFKDVLIPARDSIFVFVKVNINPSDQNNPFLVTDSIMFANDEVRQSVQLVAFGQDAHFVIPNQIVAGMKINIIAREHEHVHWTNDKPWVIYGWATVDSLGKLTIDPGTKVYVHSGGGIWVYRFGNIHINGTVSQPVEIRGDRLEPFFANDYAQWDRIWICEGSEDNIIENAVISNASIGLQLAALEEFTGNKTVVNNTIIKNNQNYGVLAQIANLEMNNCQVSGNGQRSLLLQIGDFELNHVTVANYYTQGSRKDAAVSLQNVFRQQTLDSYGNVMDNYYIGNTNATFRNTVIYGPLNNEFTTVSSKEADLNYSFVNCVVKRDSLPSTHFENCFNKDPKFVDKYRQDYNLEEDSPLIDAGSANVGLHTDILGRLRNGVPDIGAYEYYPVSESWR